MGVRDVFARASRLPAGPVTSRSATEELYGDQAGGLSIVPYLGHRDRQATPPSERLDSNPLVFGPVWKIAMRIASLPIKVYTFGAGGVREEDGKHPAYTLLRRPNKVLTRNLLVAQTVVDLLVHGRGGWLKVRDGDGPPVELWPLYGQTLKATHDPRDLIGGFTITNPKGKPVQLRPEDVCYFRLLPDHRALADGIAPFAPLMRIAALGDSAIDAGSDMFEHALLGRQSVQLKRELSTRAFNRLKRQLEAVRRDKFAIPLLDDDAELKDHVGPSDEVVLNALKTARSMIADVLGIPEDDSSASFYKNAIQPIADAIEQELERSLMPEFDVPGFPQFAFRDELRGDPLQRAQLHQTRILSGQETPDEARRDEDRPPLPDGAGANAFVPLNLIPIGMADDAETQPKDSGGGLGGDEGKGTLASVKGSRGRLAARARTNWSTLRNRIIKRNAEAMARKIRGVVNKEAKAIKSALADGRQARAEGKLPTAAELRKIIARSDASIAEILEQFMRQTGDASAPTAAELVDLDLTDEVLDRLQEVYASRAASVAERFAGVRGERIIGLVETATDKGTPIRELAGQIGDAYQNLSTAYTDGIARTEVAFAHEQAALVTWADAGVRSIEVVDGGGPCTTGVCADNASGSPYRLGEQMSDVGYSFEGADAPPFHPGCTCFVVPVVEEE